MTDLPPQSLEAERAVLACLIRWPDTFAQVADMKAADFFAPSHGRMFGAIEGLVKAGKPVDPVSLLEERGIALDQTAELGDSAATAQVLPYYAGKVKETSARRRLLVAFDHLERETRGESSIEEIVHRGINVLQDCIAGRSEFRHISEFAEEWYKSAKARAEKPDEAKPIGVPTGITPLNNILGGGLARSHMIVVGAESSQGKSALLDNGFILPAALAGASVCLCSFEDAGRSVFVRHLSSLTGLENRQLQQEVVGMTEWVWVHRDTEKIADLDIWIHDVVPSGVDSMCAQIRRHLHDHPADLLGIDYLQFIGAGVKTESSTAESMYVIKAIARLARDLKDTATVLLSQYRKLKEGAIPTDDDLRDANAVRFFAHTIMHIWCPEKAKNLGCKTLIVSKNKQGPTARVTVGWRPKTVTFCDPTEEDKRMYEVEAGLKKEGTK